MIEFLSHHYSCTLTQEFLHPLYKREGEPKAHTTYSHAHRRPCPLSFHKYKRILFTSSTLQRHISHIASILKRCRAEDRRVQATPTTTSGMTRGLGSPTIRYPTFSASYSISFPNSVTATWKRYSIHNTCVLYNMYSSIIH